jgi:purine-nucleoside phosphorylase
MSIHIGAKPGEIAHSILLPGDPLRATFIAENLLEEAICFNNVRGMKGFTGNYRGKRVSVMGTGMGMPSHSIYVNELIQEYDVQTLIRVGTAGALQPNLKLGDVVLAMSASTDSNVNLLRFGGREFAPCANFDLLLAAYHAAQAQGIRVSVGGILTSDIFYSDDPDWWKVWAEHGVLACEMETNALYTIASKLKVRALSIVTISDSLITHEEATSEQRQQGFTKMVELALDIVT